MEFDFGTSNTQNEGNNNDPFDSFQPPTEEPKQSNNNGGFDNMDFLTGQDQSQPKQTLDDMLNMNLQQPSEESKPKVDINLNMDNNFMTNVSSGVDEEEQKRIADRQREADERKEKIKEKMLKEEQLRNEIIQKAKKYLAEFEEERQENIAKKRKALEEKNSDINSSSEAKNNVDSWGKVNSNIDLKDSEYKGSKDVQRMREAMMNRTKDPNSEPLQKFFG
jgi:hypothetical protein